MESAGDVFKLSLCVCMSSMQNVFLETPIVAVTTLAYPRHFLNVFLPDSQFSCFSPSLYIFCPSLESHGHQALARQIGQWCAQTLLGAGAKKHMN